MIFGTKARQLSRAERRAMVERMNPALPIFQQCRLLALPRSSVYRKLAEVGAADLAIMALIDRHYLARPYHGSRRMAAWLATQGHHVNRKRVQRLMRLLGLAAIYQRPNTSKPAAAHKIYPYLLRGLAIERVNQVWCSDVTYIPMAKGFLYLVVIMDWVSRAVLAWRVSNTLGADFCVEALEEALGHRDRKSTRLNSSHLGISYAVFCLKKKNHKGAAALHVSYGQRTEECDRRTFSAFCDRLAIHNTRVVRNATLSAIGGSCLPDSTIRC